MKHRTIRYYVILICLVLIPGLGACGQVVQGTADSPDADGYGLPDPMPCSAGDAQAVDPDSGHCYVAFFSPAEPWERARARCTLLAEGGHLVTIGSAEEQSLVGQLATQAPTWTWTAGNDIAAEGDWVWDGGEPLDYTNWYPGEPNDAEGGEDCLVLWVDIQSVSWNDAACNIPLSYICELE